MKERREPSVPPRMLPRTGVMRPCDRLDRVLDDLRMLVQHHLHVAVLLLDREGVARARIGLHHLFRDRLQSPPWS